MQTNARRIIAFALYLACAGLDELPSVETDEWGYRHVNRRGQLGCRMRISRLACKIEGA